MSKILEIKNVCKEFGQENKTVVLKKNNLSET